MRIAIIGGGVSGAYLFKSLSTIGLISVCVDLYDQGRGVGGRASTRYDNGFEFDHGCQFFRSDSPEMKTICNDWLASGIVTEWEGVHEGNGDFFGLPHNRPVYVSANGGMNNIPYSLVQEAITLENFKLFQGVRVESIKRNDNNSKWMLLGKEGRSAYHDTPEDEAKAQSSKSLHDHDGYNIVVLTDISSSFGNWHRASAGCPASFAEAVSKRAGARVPLFSAMVSFKDPLNLPVSSLTFDRSADSKVWFAARTNSKPGFQKTNHESWTIISTPEYAISKIIETPMQDPISGAFIPQSPEYLLNVPAPELSKEFLRLIGLPIERETLYINGQRWGSALPAPRHFANDINSPTRHTLAGVNYDSGIASLAPTVNCGLQSQSFVSDDELGLYQIGDMVSSYTPGFEGAVLSAAEASKHLAAIIKQRMN